MQRLSGERRDVLELLRVCGEMRVSEIAESLGKKRPTVSFLLTKMLDAGLVESPRYGYYRVAADE